MFFQELISIFLTTFASWVMTISPVQGPPYNEFDLAKIRILAETLNSPNWEMRDSYCYPYLLAQKEYYLQDRLAETEVFAKYPITNMLKTPPVDVNINSNKFAKKFRTYIREQLAEYGVNFAGYYSIVGVGMTGWGSSHFIIDLRNGQVYLFPYYAVELEFRKDSNLILMNPKSQILDNNSCMPWGQQEAHTVRPFYFLWKNNKLVLIGPKDISPPPNELWTEYF